MAQMEQMDSFQHLAQVVSMLPSLATVLTRVKVSNMSVSWTWALGTVGCHLMSVATGHPRQHGPRGGGEAQSGADPGGPGVSAAVQGLCRDVRAASGHHPEGQSGGGGGGQQAMADDQLPAEYPAPLVNTAPASKD